jgi:hypothetical protein
LAVLRLDFAMGFFVLTFRSLPVGYVRSNPLHGGHRVEFVREREVEKNVASASNCFADWRE